MASASTTFASLRASLKKGEYVPVYLLHGEEGYFIDVLTKDFENILSEDQKVFNQYILYAPQTDMLEVVDICRRYPMMSDRIVVILKEAQSVRADLLDKLAKYVSQPSPSTILVICSRGATAKGKQLMAAIKSSDAVVFESKKIPEYQIGTHIANFIKEQGLNVDPKALEMLKEYVGNDLSRLYNEISKLTTILGPGATVTPQAIERNIGYSKEYNAYELVDALAQKDALRVFRIADYFRSNPKSTPLVLATAAIFGFFSDLLVSWYTPDKGDRAQMQALGLKSPYPLKRFAVGRRNYNASQVIEVIRALRQFDAQSKGAGSRQNEHALFHDLMYHILSAKGYLGV